MLALATVALGVLLLIAATVVAVWWRQERIAYQPPTDNPVPPAGIPRVEFTANDGQRLYAHVVKHSTGATAGVLVAFHGNADLATWQVPWARQIAERTGWCVFLAEYRGYGGLAGSPGYESVRRDARAAWDYASVHIVSTSSPIALFGHSLGSAIAVELADELGREGAVVQPTTLILQSPFTSARDMARIVLTRPVRFLWNLIARVQYDSRTKLQALDIPVWIAHGVRDWLVPVAMGRELYTISRRPGRLLLVGDAGHNDVDERGGELYWQWLSDALEGAVTAHAEPLSGVQLESRGRIGTSG